jgi:hypothetical protein
MNVGRSLKDGWNLFLADIVPLVVGGLIFSILTPLTLGVLGGPLLAGLYGMALSRARDGRPAQIGDIFRFDRFGTYVAAFYALSILFALGFALLILPGLYLAAIWLYVFPLLVERGVGLGEAMRTSRETVKRAGLSQHLGFVLVLFVLGVALGAIGGERFGGILSFLWVPLAVAFTAAAWTAVGGTLAAQPTAPVPPPGATPASA